MMMFQNIEPFHLRFLKMHSFLHFLMFPMFR